MPKIHKSFPVSDSVFLSQRHDPIAFLSASLTPPHPYGTPDRCGNNVNGTGQKQTRMKGWNQRAVPPSTASAKTSLSPSGYRGTPPPIRAVCTTQETVSGPVRFQIHTYQMCVRFCPHSPPIPVPVPIVNTARVQGHGTPLSV